MNQRLQNVSILAGIGSLALILGGQVHYDPCNKSSYPGEANKYFGPTCTVACTEENRWYYRDQSDFCGPGHGFKNCSTAPDPNGPFYHGVYKLGACEGGKCSATGAVWVTDLPYDVYHFTVLEGCDAEG